MWFGIWQGGSGYSQSRERDLETFDSIASAKEAMRSRKDKGYWEPQTFNYVNRPVESVLTPCVDESSNLWLFKENPHDEWGIPDRILEFGPRGGIKGC